MLYESYHRVRTALEPLRPIYDAWMKVIAAFSWLLARVVLTLLFFTVFIIYGIILRLTGKDPLKRRIETNRSTYWADNTVTNSGLDDLKKLY